MAADERPESREAERLERAETEAGAGAEARAETDADGEAEARAGAAARRGVDPAWILWPLLALLYFALRANLFSIPLDRDEGMFGYGGWSILQGGVPYRDFFDIKPPGVFFVNALGLALFPATPAGVHTFLHLYNFLTAIALFFVARELLESRPAGYWTAFVYAVFSSLPTLQGSTASTELFMALPLSLCVLATQRGAARNQVCSSALGGVAGALAFWIKATAASMVLFAFAFWIASLLRSPVARREARRLALRHAAAWVGGFVALTAVTAAYFAWHGAFDEFVYWSFVESFAYSRERSVGENLPYLAFRLSAIFEGSWPVAIAGAVGIVALAAKRSAAGWFAIGLLACSLLALLPGFAYRHYFAQLAPAVALAGGLGLERCLAFVRGRGAKLAASALAIAAVGGAPLIAHPEYYHELGPDDLARRSYGWNPFPESLDVAAFIRARSAESDRVLVFGSEPQILLYTGRVSATAFAITYPLMRAYPRYMEFQRTAWREIEAELPRYVVYVYHANSFLHDGKAELWIRAQLDALLRQRYALEAIMPIAQPKGKIYFGDALAAYWPKVKDRRRRHLFVYRLVD